MEIICLDTDILIDHKRAKERNKTKLYDLSLEYQFASTVVTVYELLRNDNSDEDQFWKAFFEDIKILQFDLECAQIAAIIHRNLKKKGRLVGVEDILIAAIAMKNNLKIATNNTRHFSLIPVDLI